MIHLCTDVTVAVLLLTIFFLFTLITLINLAVKINSQFKSKCMFILVEEKFVSNERLEIKRLV